MLDTFAGAENQQGPAVHRRGGRIHQQPATLQRIECAGHLAVLMTPVDLTSWLHVSQHFVIVCAQRRAFP